MESFMIYLLKVNGIISILFLGYFLFLRNEKFFRLNRIFLLGSMMIALLLPLMPSLNYTTATQLQEQLPIIHSVTDFYSKVSASTPVAGLKEQLVAAPDSEVQVLRSYSFGEILFMGYVGVALVLLLRFAYQLVNLYILIRKHPKQILSDGIHYYEHEQAMSPFSFFRSLFINPAQYDTEQVQQIIAHEKVHVQQWHTLDILITEIIQVILWVNPIVHILKQHVKLNLEYLADESVLNRGVDRKKYQLNILQSSLNPDRFPLTNMFNSSKLKLRIKMMNSEKTPMKNVIRYAWVLPVIAIIYFAINPIRANSLSSHNFVQKDLRIFEGYYQFHNDEKFFLQILVRENNLVLHQLWDSKEIVFDRVEELQFSGADGTFPLLFKTDKKGNIDQAIAFGKDVWHKTDDYPEANAVEVQLTVEQLKKLEGYYRYKKDQGGYIKFFVRGQQLIAQQMWDNKEHVLVAYSDTKFKSKDKGLPAEFIKDANGNVVQVLVLNSDLMDKVDEYKPVERKIVKLTPSELKAVEGYYQFEKDKKYYVHVYVQGDNIVLKQLWDKEERVFNPESALTFSANLPSMKITFNKDTRGNVVQMLSVTNELLNKVKDYKPATK